MIRRGWLFLIFFLLLQEGCELITSLRGVKYVILTPKIALFINSNSPEKAISDERLLVGRFSQYQQGDITRSLLKFDLSEISPKIEGAILLLYLDSGDYSFDIPTEIGAYVIKEDWAKSSINWRNQPKIEEVYAIKVKVEDKGEYKPKEVKFDLTRIVIAWQEKKIPNYGILLKAIDESKFGTLKQFFGLGEKISSHTSSPFKESIKPQLIIGYR
jgi:hypothetical protein